LDQFSLNWFFGISNIVISFGFKLIWDSYNELKKTDKDINEKLNHVEILVAGQYVKRDDFDKVSNHIFSKLDKIIEKLDKKADK